MIISDLKVADLKANQQVAMQLLVRRKNLARSRNGKDYLNLRLGDRSGEITAFLWDDVEVAEAEIGEGDCVEIKGLCQIYNGKLQLNLSFIKLWLGPVDPLKFLPHTDKHIPTMERDLRRMVMDLRDPWLRRLGEAFFVKDQAFVRSFSLAPAAKAMHHAWLGGLLEHTLGVARLALQVCPLYPQVDGDLVLAGALLHDIGKVEELVYERSLDYSTPGRLLGHVMIGARMVREKASNIKGFPAETLMLLEHLMLSHHGEYEYGSPKKPKTQEAVLLNFIDDLDAKLVAIDAFMHAARELGSEWSDFHRLFGRPFYLGSKGKTEGADPGASPDRNDEAPLLF
ncbi:MAG: HD domain-containing protein [Deltaproteobacteria bacterium]|nr:HD domain-containing protein [Deltaproteobacteria bacterium]